MVKLLFGRGDVDVNSKDKSGQTPLLLAAGRGHEAADEALGVQ
jgi:ankyrin repeat protein